MASEYTYRRHLPLVSPLVRLAIFASVAISLLVAFQQNESADASFSGDFNCDTSVNTDDMLSVLGVAGGVTPLSSCANSVSVDCDGDVDVADAIMLLNYLAGFTVDLPDECSEINALIPGTSPADAADELHARISGEGSLLDIVRAVEEALARGGVSTGDLDGAIYTQAVQPAALSRAIPLEVENLAVAARTGSYQTDAAELGDMLAELEWPFLDDGSTPGEQIVAMLTELVIGAQAAPNDPNAFAPLFLQNMAMAQDPPVDLSTGDAVPEDVHFDLLSLRLLFAVFERQATYTDAVQVVAVPAATPCSDAKKVLDGIYGPFGGSLQGIGQSEAGSKFVEKGLEKAGISAGNNDKIGKAMSVLGTIAKIWKLIDFYASTQVDVKIIDGSDEVHKPNENQADVERTFNAVAGVSESDMKEYEAANSDAGAGTRQAVRDCMGSFGLPVFSDLGDLMKDAANWKIEWTIDNNRVNLRNETAISWKPANQEAGQPRGGNWRSDTVKTSEYSYEAAFHVDIGDEQAAEHNGGDLKIADVRVCGNVESAQPPDLVALTFAAKGVLGLVDSIAELAAGMMREVAPPQSCKTLRVTWHEPCAVGQVSGAVVPAGAGEIPAYCGYTGTATATYELSAANYADNVSMTATGLKYKLQTFQFGATTLYVYQLVAGQVSWNTNGFFVDGPRTCSYEGSGSFPAPAPASADPFAQPFIHYIPLDEEFPIYRARGDTFEEGEFTETCPDAGPGYPDSTQTYAFNPFLHWLNAPDNGDYRVDAEGNLKGTYIEGDAGDGLTTWTWDLAPDLCPQSASVTPQGPGTCGGAASLPRAW